MKNLAIIDPSLTFNRTNTIVEFGIHAKFNSVLRRGGWRVRTTDTFVVESCSCPEYSEAGRLYIPGDSPSRDGDRVQCLLGGFPFVNTQVVVANALIKHGLNERCGHEDDDYDDYPEEEEECEDDF